MSGCTKPPTRQKADDLVYIAGDLLACLAVGRGFVESAKDHGAIDRKNANAWLRWSSKVIRRCAGRVPEDGTRSKCHSRRWWKAKPAGEAISREKIRRELADCNMCYGQLSPAYQEVLRESWMSSCQLLYWDGSGWSDWKWVPVRADNDLRLNPSMIFRIGLELEPLYYG